MLTLHQQEYLKFLIKIKKQLKSIQKNGKVVETTIECEGGYPVITYDNKRQTVVVYGLDKAVIGNGKNVKTEDGDKIKLELYPELYNLYKELM